MTPTLEEQCSVPLRYKCVLVGLLGFEPRPFSFQEKITELLYVPHAYVPFI